MNSEISGQNLLDPPGIDYSTRSSQRQEEEEMELVEKKQQQQQQPSFVDSHQDTIEFSSTQTSSFDDKLLVAAAASAPIEILAKENELQFAEPETVNMIQQNLDTTCSDNNNIDNMPNKEPFGQGYDILLPNAQSLINNDELIGAAVEQDYGRHFEKRVHPIATPDDEGIGMENFVSPPAVDLVTVEDTTLNQGVTLGTFNDNDVRLLDQQPNVDSERIIYKTDQTDLVGSLNGNVFVEHSNSSIDIIKDDESDDADYVQMSHHHPQHSPNVISGIFENSVVIDRNLSNGKEILDDDDDDGLCIGIDKTKYVPPSCPMDDEKHLDMPVILDNHPEQLNREKLACQLTAQDFKEPSTRIMSAPNGVIGGVFDNQLVISCHTILGTKDEIKSTGEKDFVGGHLVPSIPGAHNPDSADCHLLDLGDEICTCRIMSPETTPGQNELSDGSLESPNEVLSRSNLEACMPHDVVCVTKNAANEQDLCSNEMHETHEADTVPEAMFGFHGNKFEEEDPIIIESTQDSNVACQPASPIITKAADNDTDRVIKVSMENPIEAHFTEIKPIELSAQSLFISPANLSEFDDDHIPVHIDENANFKVDSCHEPLRTGASPFLADAEDAHSIVDEIECHVQHPVINEMKNESLPVKHDIVLEDHSKSEGKFQNGDHEQSNLTEEFDPDINKLQEKQEILADSGAHKTTLQEDIAIEEVKHDINHEIMVNKDLTHKKNGIQTENEIIVFHENPTTDIPKVDSLTDEVISGLESNFSDKNEKQAAEIENKIHHTEEPVCEKINLPECTQFKVIEDLKTCTPKLTTMKETSAEKRHEKKTIQDSGLKSSPDKNKTPTTTTTKKVLQEKSVSAPKQAVLTPKPTKPLKSPVASSESHKVVSTRQIMPSSISGHKIADTVKATKSIHPELKPISSSKIDPNTMNRRTQSHSPTRPAPPPTASESITHQVVGRSTKESRPKASEMFAERKKKREENSVQKKVVPSDAQQLDKEQRRKDAEAAFQNWLQRKELERKRTRSTGRPAQDAVRPKETKSMSNGKKSDGGPAALQSWTERKAGEKKKQINGCENQQALTHKVKGREDFV